MPQPKQKWLGNRSSLRLETVSQCVQSRECHAEQREAYRIFRMLRRRDSSAEFILSTSKGLRMTLRHSLLGGSRHRDRVVTKETE